MTPESIDSLLLPQVEKGNIHPSQYARLVDRYRTWVTKQPQLYGEWLEDYRIGEIHDIGNVDQRRAQIGLPPLSHFCKMKYLSAPKNYRPQ